MKTDTNLHVQLEAMVARWVPVKSQSGPPPRVLDLGCGQGALAQRLFDLGYEVIGVDRDPVEFKASGPQFIAADLNDPAAVDRLVGRFARSVDLILAIEVIEHLRCPWEFLAVCRQLSGRHTHLLVSSPNVSSWWSRFWFFLTGDLWGFNAESWDDPGHVHAVTVTEMEGMLRENGFECHEIVAAGSLPIIWAYNWKRFMVSLFMLPLRLVMRGHKDGWVLCYHARLGA
jgi:2-polyprenyl-3-methyl-5-hydroxy-6-metoxy-1,4-benzoquinol methylase